MDAAGLASADAADSIQLNRAVNETSWGTTHYITHDKDLFIIHQLSLFLSLSLFFLIFYLFFS